MQRALLGTTRIKPPWRRTSRRGNKNYLAVTADGPVVCHPAGRGGLLMHGGVEFVRSDFSARADTLLPELFG